MSSSPCLHGLGEEMRTDSCRMTGNKVSTRHMGKPGTGTYSESFSSIRPKRDRLRVLALLRDAYKTMLFRCLEADVVDGSVRRIVARFEVPALKLRTPQSQANRIACR